MKSYLWRAIRRHAYTYLDRDIYRTYIDTFTPTRNIHVIIFICIYIHIHTCVCRCDKDPQQTHFGLPRPSLAHLPNMHAEDQLQAALRCEALQNLGLPSFKVMSHGANQGAQYPLTKEHTLNYVGIPGMI